MPGSLQGRRALITGASSGIGEAAALAMVAEGAAVALGARKDRLDDLADRIEAEGGDVVNVASVAGRVASLGAGVYNMTKRGVVGYSESLRQEGVHIGVRVTVIEPGFVDTELQGHNTNPIVVEQIEKVRQSAGKVLEAADIANAIVYAASQPEHVSINEILVRPASSAR